MEKEEYQKEVDNEFRELSSRIDRIRAAFDSVEETDKMQLEMEVENLFQKREAAKQKINNLTSAEDDWEHFRTEAEVAEQELRAAVDEANSLLSRLRQS